MTGLGEPTERCNKCKKYHWWRDAHGEWKCRKCHPPAEDEIVIFETRIHGHYKNSKRLIHSYNNHTPVELWPKKIGGTSQDRKDYIEAWAKQTLKENNLPTTVWVLNGKEVPDLKALSSTEGVGSLDIYLKGKYEYDEAPRIAATILWHLMMINEKASSPDDYFREGWELGRLAGIVQTQFGATHRQYKEKGKKGGERRWSDEAREKISDIVGTLSVKKDALADPVPAVDLWNELCGDMDNAGLNPKESSDCSFISYGNGNKKYTFEAFRKAIERKRNP